jgi:hypothetical protein
MYNIQASIVGRCQIYSGDDLMVDEYNAIHPQNLSRVFARALSNEHNYFINRVAFGNGGTTIDIAGNESYNPPNDGQSPDDATWDSRLYNEIFSKIVNAGSVVLNPLLGIDPGSADINVGHRAGGGSVPANDPTSIPHVSGPGVRSIDRGLISDVVITVYINTSEPTEYVSTQTSFEFNEIGLFTSGNQAISTNGYQYIDVGNRLSTDPTTLVPGTTYKFRIAVNRGSVVLITFTPPVAGGTGSTGQILYGDLCEAINNGSRSWGMLGITPLPGGAIMSITDTNTGRFPSIDGLNTNGYLTISSTTSGTTSTILLDDTSWTSRETVSFLQNINKPLGGVLLDPTDGVLAGMRNSPTASTSERERLLTHLIFTPIIKDPTKVLKIVYTLSLSVARSPD